MGLNHLLRLFLGVLDDLVGVFRRALGCGLIIVLGGFHDLFFLLTRVGKDGVAVGDDVLRLGHFRRELVLDILHQMGDFLTVDHALFAGKEKVALAGGDVVFQLVHKLGEIKLTPSAFGVAGVKGGKLGDILVILLLVDVFYVEIGFQIIKV